MPNVLCEIVSKLSFQLIKINGFLFWNVGWFNSFRTRFFNNFSCSLVCYKTHKQTPCEKPKQPDASQSLNLSYQFPTPDTVAQERLKELSKSFQSKTHTIDFSDRILFPISKLAVMKSENAWETLMSGKSCFHLLAVRTLTKQSKRPWRNQYLQNWLSPRWRWSNPTRSFLSDTQNANYPKC